MDDIDRKHPLFEGVLACRVERSASSPSLSSPLSSHTALASSHGETRTSDMCVRLYEATITKSGGVRVPGLYMELWDTKDLLSCPLFWSISDAEFSAVAHENALLMQWKDFSYYFVSLLRAATAGEGSANERSGEERRGEERGGPDFPFAKDRLSVRLHEGSGGSAEISWIETNAFKATSHLLLHCRYHTDASMKQFLLARMKHWQKTAERQSNTLERAASDMSALKNAYETATAEATRLRIELEGREAKLKLAHAKEVSELRERAAATTAEMEGLKTKEIIESTAKTDALIGDLRARLDALQSAHASLQSDKSSVDMRLREVQNALTSACAEATGFQAENAKLRAALSESEDVRIAQAKELTSALTRVAVLEQCVADRGDVLSRTQELLAAGEEAKRNSEESATLYKGQCAKLQQKLETCSSEIERGNGIITKLQEEYKSVRTKAKAKAEAVRALEATLADRSSTIDTLQREISALRGDVERERAGRESSEGIIVSLKTQIGEARDVLANNQQVIAWLNKELNEAHAHQTHMSRPLPASLSSSFVTPPSLLSSPLQSPPPSNLPRYKASSTVGSSAPTPPAAAPVAAPVPAPTSAAPVRTPAKPLASSQTLLAKDSNPYLQPLMSGVAGGSPGLLTVPQQATKSFSPAFSYEGYGNTAPHVHAAL